MKKEKINVPEKVRYFRDWKEFDIANYQHPFILNKVVPGCGFTTYALENQYPTILCSPRKKLLENKYQQTPGSFYLDFQLEDKEDDIIRKGQDLANYLSTTQLPKILCTYDSFKHVRRIIGENFINQFYVIIDVFSNIFIDSQFKGDVELEFTNYLKGLNRLCFVSATPYIEEYLDEVDIFKDLPYIELDWDALEPGRLVKPKLLVVKGIRSITEKISEIVEKYLSNKFDKEYYVDKNGTHCIESTEAVIYVNSVEYITRIIKKFDLKPDQVNIICAETPYNKARLKKVKHTFGRIPLKGEPHKMFTFCTSTAYIGSDFYSTNARTFIFSDANIDCLATDISMDLPQIIGRQRLDENPWKGTAEFYYRIRENEEDYEKILQTRLDETKSIMKWYEEEQNNPEHKNKFLSFIKNDSSNINFESYYLSVSDKGTLEYNKFVYISQKRAYEISQIDYRDRYQVLNAIESSGVDYSLSDKQKSFLGVLNSFSKLDEKLRYFVYNTDLTEDEKKRLFGMGVPYPIERVYELLGPERIKSLGCIYRNCKAELDSRSAFSELDFENEIYKEFKEGETYTNADLKDKLQKIYDSCNGQIGKMKASDMSRYFELKQTMTTIDGKRVVCQTLLKKKKV